MLCSRRAKAVCAFFTLGGLLLAGCGSTSSSGDAGSAGVGAAGTGSGGSRNGGAGASGGGSAGSQSSGGGSAGTQSNGGGAAGTQSNGGGAAGTGAGGALSGCHTAADCPSNTPGSVGFGQCLVPGESAPQQTGCGAVGWCGQCACPPMPVGNGQLCHANTDCPVAAAGFPSASVCVMGACSQCGVSTDCPAQTPVCGLSRGVGLPVRMCNTCLADSDCPSGAPHCASSFGQTSCVACVADRDCAIGICTGGACMPQCGPTKPCGSLSECGPSLRCQPLSCASSATCPTNTGCIAGHCQRRSCSKDSDCDQGGCVNTFCYESLGTCFTQMLVP